MKRILIDTHIFLWSLFEPKRIKKAHREILVNPEVEILVSTISDIEIGIKKSIDKLRFAQKTSELTDLAGFSKYPISSQHIDFLNQVNWLHKDPFDKLIISQCLCDDLNIMSYDSYFPLYDLKLLK